MHTYTSEFALEISMELKLKSILQRFTIDFNEERRADCLFSLV